MMYMKNISMYITLGVAEPDDGRTSSAREVQTALL